MCVCVYFEIVRNLAVQYIYVYFIYCLYIVYIYIQSAKREIASAFEENKQVILFLYFFSSFFHSFCDSVFRNIFAFILVHLLMFESTVAIIQIMVPSTLSHHIIGHFQSNLIMHCTAQTTNKLITEDLKHEY